MIRPIHRIQTFESTNPKPGADYYNNNYQAFYFLRTHSSESRKTTPNSLVFDALRSETAALGEIGIEVLGQSDSVVVCGP